MHRNAKNPLWLYVVVISFPGFVKCNMDIMIPDVAYNHNNSTLKI